MRDCEYSELNLTPPSTDESMGRTMDPSPLCLSDLPIPTPPPMHPLLMTSRYDLSSLSNISSLSTIRSLSGYSTFRGRNSEFGTAGRAVARPRCFGRYSMSANSLRGPEFGSPMMARAEFNLAPQARSWRMPNRPVIKVATCR